MAQPHPRRADLSSLVLKVHALCSTAVWGPDAKEWRPQRWLDGRTINAVKRDDAGYVRWQPFSSGPQGCIGQHLALVRNTRPGMLVKLMQATWP